MEKDQKGRLLMALLPTFREASGDPLKRYNGGWTKTVTGLDKSKTNGYSLLGEFESHPGSLAWRTPGLYLDCDINGSRKNQVSYYRLFALDTKGVVTQLGETLRYSPDWAVKLWPAIEAFLLPPIEPAMPGDEAESLRDSHHSVDAATFGAAYVPGPDACPAPGVYRHFKGGRYRLNCIARHSETGETMVVYTSLDGPHEGNISVRPLAMWAELVAPPEGGPFVPRFTWEGRF